MSEIVLLDGGMGQELFRRSGEKPHPLWSGKILMDQPELVLNLHKEFIEAGARVITVNSYSSTPGRIERDGQPEWFSKLQELAVKIAIQAVEETASKHDQVSIAGCLPPLYASYHPGTSPETYDECFNQYKLIADHQYKSVDFFLCETMSSVKEATASANAGLSTGKNTWSALSVSDQNPSELRSGESLEQALEAITDLPVGAVLLNCSTPEAITEAMDILKSAAVPFGAYANGFTSVDALKPGGTVDALNARNNLSPKQYSEFVFQWLDMGAKIIGGCCEIGVEHISYLAEELDKRGCHVTGFLNK